ncbi:hypothetical protein VPH35_132328 [Triticum aestivum]|uniref:DUF1618 domain-containing protein n=1 Tax=Triticum turgidum subsp. durum TaxID=4567 RepID=A0A9R1C5A4_TRITD|nr:uncharacterized protein LOC123172869 [Triticum aestivum]VAI92820.1 unnamed protein product [Triticum turgidum subsp. durum]
MAAASSSTVLNPPPLPDGEGHDPASWILLDTLGSIAECPNASFAQSSTSTGQRIEVSFCTARPPHVSHFCVHCPGLGPADFSLAPTVISAEADLVLFCVSASPSILFNPRYCDYFLYRAHPRCPVLELLPHPYPHQFRDKEVALLSLGDDGAEYAIAILTSRCLKVSLKEDGTLNETEFDLCLYRSSRAQEGWTSKVVSVADPLRDAVCPTDCAPYHETTKVITLGRGMVCWVDLWRGILLCNVLEENPLLLDIPLPLPARGNWRLYHKSSSYKYRDITVSPLKDTIKYIEIEVCPPRNPPADESYMDWFHQKRRDKRCNAPCTGWKARTWSLSTTTIPSWKWRLDCTLDVADIDVQPIHSEQLPRTCSITDNLTQATCLQRLIIGFPTLSMDDDVVYMLSKACPEDQMEVVIAIDMSKKTLQGVTKLVTGKDFTDTRICTSEISKYLSKDEVAR